MKNKEAYQFLFNSIDFILWKYWEPIGGGQLGIPRDEYSSYTSKIVSAKIEGKSIKNIADILFLMEEEEMGMKGNIEHDLRIADKIVSLDVNGKLNPTDIHFYIEQFELRNIELISKFRRPSSYYVFEMTQMKDNFTKIERQKIVSVENYLDRWKEIVNLGFTWINLAPLGYWQQAFVFCIEFKISNIHESPVGMTQILVPGLPMKSDGSEISIFEDNVCVVD